MTHSKDLTWKKDATRFPQDPGIYQFFDEKGKVLYIGKAKNLRRRISSYLKPGRDNRPQIPSLIQRTEKLSYILTASEREAFLLENNLIKRHQPPFNISLKDDKTYKNIRISQRHPYPALTAVRSLKNDPLTLNFGPYCSARDVNNAMLPLQKLFQLRDCSDAEFQRRKRPCIKHQLELCSAPCVGRISSSAYQETVKGAIHFLRGRNQQCLRYLAKQRARFVNQMAFEQAGKIHDQIQAMKALQKHPSAVSGFRENGDAIGLAREGDALAFHILIIREGNIISTDRYAFNTCAGEDADNMRHFLEQYYTGPRGVPSYIWVSVEPHDRKLLEETLRELRVGPVKIRYPRRGQKATVINMAIKNAREALKHFLEDQRKEGGLLEAMMTTFHLTSLPKHIECFDISHSRGKDTVGAKVVFRRLKPSKKEYRRYIIQSNLQPGDDYGSLREVLLRRFNNTGKIDPTPDLIILDGGRGQLKVIQKVLQQLHLDVDCIAIAKETHAKNSRDRIFLPGRKNPVSLRDNSPILHKVMAIRDETHRFAIQFHKQRRNKRVLNQN